MSIEQGLSSIEGCYQHVFSYQNGTWKGYNPLKSNNTLNKLSPDYGYWIKINCSEINWQIVVLEENCTNTFDDDLDEYIDCDDNNCNSYPDCIDNDGDGYIATVDCDDTNANVNPGAIEVCNSIDDDCYPASSDGSEDPLNGQACDGADSDLCNEGTRSCIAGALICSDNTGDAVEICNGIDDDCDGQTDEGVSCDDGNLCTDDACVAGKCLYDCIEGRKCDDGNPNTIQDICTSNGGCICVGTPI